MLDVESAETVPAAGAAAGAAAGGAGGGAAGAAATAASSSAFGSSTERLGSVIMIRGGTGFPLAACRAFIVAAMWMTDARGRLGPECLQLML